MQSVAQVRFWPRVCKNQPPLKAASSASQLFYRAKKGFQAASAFIRFCVPRIFITRFKL